MAELLTSEQLRVLGVESDVISRGSLEDGLPATDGAIAAMHRRGLDLSSHTSRSMTADDVGSADLILTMERRHLSQVGEIDLSAVRRSFTLLELEQVAAYVGPRPIDEPIDRWVALADQRRDPARVLSQSTHNDIADPMGRPHRAYRRTASRLDDAVQSILGHMFPR